MKQKQLIPLALSLLIAGTVHAQKKFVVSGIGGPHTGTSWATAYSDLQVAINTATPGDSLFVAKGNYFPSLIAGVGTDRDKTILMRDLVSVFGGFAGTEATLDDRDPSKMHGVNASHLNGNIGVADSSDNVYHVVTAINISNRTTLDGFVVSSGNSDGSGTNVILGATISRANGGGIYCYKSDLSLNNLLVENNTTLAGGGGLYNNSSPVTLDNSTIQLNKVAGADPAMGGGAGMLNVMSNAKISNSSFMRNQALHTQGGGGMRNENSAPELFQVEFYQNSTEDGDGGGGVYNASNSNAILRSVNFEMNTTQNQGGGMYNDNSSPVLNDVSFYQSKADGGGGAMENDGGSNAFLNSVYFTENSTSGNGGAIQNWKSSPKMTNVIFEGNNSSGDGGAVYNYNTCSPVLTSCIFYANEAGNDGGGFFNKRASHPVMTNCIYAQNIAGHDGGGIYNTAADGTGSEPSNPVLTNVTISNNTAGNTGGGGYDDGFGKTRLRNSIITGNTAPGTADVDAPLTVLDSVSASIIEDLYYRKGLTVTPALITTAIFLDPSTDDYRLAKMSPGIDKGDSTAYKIGMTPDLSGIATDLMGAKRVMGLNVDLGAFEVCTDTIKGSVTVVAAPGTSVTTGTPVTFTAAPVNPGPTPTYKWLKNGAFITATLTPTYTAIAGTDFTTGDKISVTLITDLEEGPCVSTDTANSNQLTMMVYSTGIAEWDNGQASVSIVPNPNNGSFALNVTGIEGKEVTMTVTDLTGRAVYTESFTGSASPKTLNLNGKVTTGTYLLSLEGNEVNRQVKRFTIQ